MPHDLAAIDISDNPELVRLAEAVRLTGTPKRLRQAGKDVAIVSPVPQPTKRRIANVRPFSKDDSLWNLQAIGMSGVSDVSENTETYLAEGYLDRRDE